MGNTGAVINASPVHIPGFPSRPAVTLRGRSWEREAISGLVALAAQGAGGALVIHGELGTGKSALLDYAATQAAGHTILRCRGYAEESALPLAAVYDLIKPLRAEAAILDTPDRLALSRALLDLLTTA